MDIDIEFCVDHGRNITGVLGNSEETKLYWRGSCLVLMRDETKDERVVALGGNNWNGDLDVRL
jgi:hypothetical protein